jgi:flagellar biosynthesis chaperone FliJ
MDKTERKARGQLQTLERWRSAQLESAQTQHAQLNRIATEKESARDRVQAGLDDTQSFVRERLAASQPINVQSLRQIGEFTAVQREDLAAADAALEASRAQCATAHTALVKQFEELSVVQRLSRRRQLEAGRDAARAQQKRLDEQALSRLAADTASRAKQPQE